MLEPQRSDLWQLDLSGVSQKINALLASGAVNLIAAGAHVVLPLPAYFYAYKVVPPRLSIKAEEVYQGPRPYSYPGADEPCGDLRVDFIHDTGNDPNSNVYRSPIYTLLTAWRNLVRSGRGGMSIESVGELDPATFKRDPRFDVILSFIKGAGTVGLSNSNFTSTLASINSTGASGAPRPPLSQTNPNQAPTVTNLPNGIQTRTVSGASLDSNMEFASTYMAASTWLSSFQVSELNHHGSSNLVTISAVFHCNDFVQM